MKRRICNFVDCRIVFLKHRITIVVGSVVTQGVCRDVVTFYSCITLIRSVAEMVRDGPVLFDWIGIISMRYLGGTLARCSIMVRGRRIAAHRSRISTLMRVPGGMIARARAIARRNNRAILVLLRAPCTVRLDTLIPWVPAGSDPVRRQRARANQWRLIASG